MRKILFTAGGIVGVSILVLAAAFIYQQVRSGQEAAAFPPPGRLIDVGGHRLHLSCLGEGEPTLIIDAGAADWSLSWMALQPELARQTRTCVYDRAGLGWSEPGPAPRDSDQLVSELNILLQAAEIAPPYVLLGHSLGGYNARIFQERYPDQVAGIILLDSGHEEQWSRFPPEVTGLLNQQVSLLESMAVLGHVGVPRLLIPAHPHLAAELGQMHAAHMAQPHHLAASAAEVGHGFVSAQQAGLTGDLGDVPLVVISAEQSFEAFRPLTDQIPFEESNAVWMELQNELAGLSTNSVHLISDTADHNVNFTDPEMIEAGLAEMLMMVGE